MKAGNKYVNRSQIGARPWETPFGGAKDSGTGPKAGGRHLVARFGKARQHHRPHPIPNDSIEWSQEDIVATETVLDEAAIHRAQHRWATTDWHERMNVLENLENRLTDWIDGAKVTPGLSGTINLQALSDRIRAFQQNAPHYLSPQETIGLPGERNEQVHDWSLGVGLIWTAQESFADFVSAAAASLLMGNAVIIPATREGLFARTLLLQAGVPEDVLVPLATSSRATLSGFDFDFVVAHGVEGFQVQQAAITQPRERRGFRRVIGVMEDPTESRYLTYFAHETTRIERTLRHGADLDLRGVLSG